MRTTILAVICFTLLAVGAALAVQPWYDLPELPPPYEFGNILISRNSAKHDLPSVSFSHWRHRLLYTCRVCHLELGFMMKANTTEITEEANKSGEYCGTCHDGETAFGHTEENCRKCHNGDISSGKGKFGRLRRLPRDRFGNRIDWTLALRRRLIKPKRSLYDDSFEPMEFDKVLELEAEFGMIPPAVFSHRVHNQWLDCANCHPDIFNIQKKGTKHFLMKYILEGKFCGVCHLRVAIPIDDCKRCHPGIKTEM